DSHRRELEPELHLMLLRAAEIVDQYPVAARLDPYHPAAVDDGIGQEAIGIVISIGQVERLGRCPSPQPCARPVLPDEGSGRSRLPAPVDKRSVVSSRAAKKVPPRRLAGVA